MSALCPQQTDSLNYNLSSTVLGELMTQDISVGAILGYAIV